MEQTAVSKRENGFTQVRANEWRVFAKAFGITLEEFESKWRGSRVHDRGRPAGIPVINRAPAGRVASYDHDQYAGGEYHGALEYIDRGEIDDDLAFALIVVGDSMEPALLEGDYVVFSPLTVPKPKVKLENGQVVFVRFTAESAHDGVTLARWYMDDGETIRLQKDNRAYPPLLIRREDIAQLAVCIERRTRRI